MPFLNHSQLIILRARSKQSNLRSAVAVGNLGAQPEYHQLEAGLPSQNAAVAKFPLGTTEAFKYKHGKTHTNTDWHTIVLWRSFAELTHKYLQKGSLVYVEGKLKTRSEAQEKSNTAQCIGN